MTLDEYEARVRSIADWASRFSIECSREQVPRMELVPRTEEVDGEQWTRQRTFDDWLAEKARDASRRQAREAAAQAAYGDEVPPA